MPKERKITCKNFLEELSDYLDGAVEPALRVEIEAHLARCPNCWVVFNETERTIRIVQDVECHPLSQEVHTRLMRVLEERLRADVK